MPSKFKKCDYCGRNLRIEAGDDSHHVEIQGGLYKVCSPECRKMMKGYVRLAVMEAKGW